jgi:hypothetical protein
VITPSSSHILPSPSISTPVLQKEHTNMDMESQSMSPVQILIRRFIPPQEITAGPVVESCYFR